MEEEYKALKLLQPIWSAAQTKILATCPADIPFSAQPDFLLLKRGKNKMKITYDKQVDAINKISLDTLLTYEIAADTIGDWVQLKKPKHVGD